MTTESGSPPRARAFLAMRVVARVTHCSSPTKGGTTMNRQEMMVADAEREVVQIHATLVRHARYLADRMATLADRLEHEGVDRSVNELGEVQGLGADVDRSCALLHAARRTRDLVRRVVETTVTEGR